MQSASRLANQCRPTCGGLEPPTADGICLDELFEHHRSQRVRVDANGRPKVVAIEPLDRCGADARRYRVKGRLGKVNPITGSELRRGELRKFGEDRDGNGRQLLGRAHRVGR